MHTSKGFTLVELMVTVVVVAILAAVAIPAYIDYVIRGKLPEAHSELANFRVQMEQYYQDNRNYGTATCGVANPTGLRYFSVTCALGATDQAFTATASSIAGVGLGAAGSYVFTVNESNARSTTAFTGASGLPAGCWYGKKSDTC